MTHRFTIIILSRVDTRCCCTACRHRLIAILSEFPHFLLFVVMYTLHHFWSYKWAFCNDSLQRYHVIEMCRTESARIAWVFSKASDVGTIIHLKQLAKVRCPSSLNIPRPPPFLSAVCLVARLQCFSEPDWKLARNRKGYLAACVWSTFALTPFV